MYLYTVVQSINPFLLCKSDEKYGVNGHYHIKLLTCESIQ